MINYQWRSQRSGRSRHHSSSLSTCKPANRRSAAAELYSTTTNVPQNHVILALQFWLQDWLVVTDVGSGPFVL